MTREEMEKLVDKAWVSNAAGPDYLWPGSPLEPRLWEALRIELQTRYRRSTGETMAVLSVQLTAEPSDLPRDPALIGIADEMRESGGHWQPCTGCYDTEDGHPTQKYDYSPALQTSVGCGCHECGGLGAVWWHMTEQELADFARICTEADSGSEGPGYLDFITPDEVFDKGPEAVRAWQKGKHAELWSGKIPDTTAVKRSDSDLLGALASNYWDLRCVNVPTGGDDFDVDWIVVEHFMAEPSERTIAHAYRDDPRTAIDRAIRATDPQAERCVSCDEVLHDGDSVFYEHGEGGHVHSFCVTDDPKSYVDEDEQPLKDGSALLKPFHYKLER